MTSPKAAAEIQRWDVEDTYTGARLSKHPDGDLVLYNDHLAALAQHTAEQRERVEAAAKEINERYCGPHALVQDADDVTAIILKHLEGQL